MSDTRDQSDWWPQFRRAAIKDAVLWLALLALVAASVLAAKTVRTYGFAVDLGSAVLQVALLAAFFMQLRGARPLILLTSASASVFLLSMFVLTLNDLFTRL